MKPRNRLIALLITSLALFLCQDVTAFDSGDLEKIGKGSYYKSVRVDWDTTGDAIYIGKHVEVNADSTETTWEIKKLTWDSGNPTYIQGPLKGAWTNRTGLGW